MISIIEHEEGVRLKMEDGSTEEGDIVVGCDGAHSVVRDAMWRMASKVSPGLITTQEKECKVSLSVKALSWVLMIDYAFISSNERRVYLSDWHGSGYTRSRT